MTGSGDPLKKYCFAAIKKTFRNSEGFDIIF